MRTCVYACACESTLVHGKYFIFSEILAVFLWTVLPRSWPIFSSGNPCPGGALTAALCHMDVAQAWLKPMHTNYTFLNCIFREFLYGRLCVYFYKLLVFLHIYVCVQFIACTLTQCCFSLTSKQY